MRKPANWRLIRELEQQQLSELSRSNTKNRNYSALGANVGYRSV